MQVRDEDIFLAAYPKTGSTWLHELVYLVSHDFNYNKIKEEAQMMRLPCIEGAGIMNVDLLKNNLKHDLDVELYKSTILKRENPRNFKTHLCFSLLPEAIRDETKMPKIIVPLRNPYDVCVSFYHHSKLMYNYTGTFDQFCQLFLAGRVIIKLVAEFLGKKFSDDDIVKAANYLSFENMKKNPDLNQEHAIEHFYVKYNLASERSSFIRSGTEGGYKTVMSPEMIKKFDAWVEENIVGTGIVF